MAATLDELKSSHAASSASLQSLSSSVTSGLSTLSKADEAQTASGSSAGKRLEQVERDVAEIKKTVAIIATAANKQPTADPALKEIKAQQALILERLANATAAWSFDYETVLAQAKTASYTYSAHVSKFLQRWATKIQTEYPHALESARQYALQGVDLAKVYGAEAQLHAGDAQMYLSELLQKNGVPKEFVAYVVYAIFALALLFVATCAWIVLSSLLACLCCCRGSKLSKAQKRAAKTAAAEKKGQ